MLKRNNHGWYELRPLVEMCGGMAQTEYEELTQLTGAKKMTLNGEPWVRYAIHREHLLTAIEDGLFRRCLKKPDDAAIAELWRTVSDDSYYDLDQLIRLPARKVKARAYLDAHRGQPMPFDRGGGGWRPEAANYCPGGIIPDTNWYTGCTPELWDVAKDIDAEPLYVWLFLLGWEMPYVGSERELAGHMGLVGIRTSLNTLEDMRLITRAPMNAGVAQQILAVHPVPAAYKPESNRAVRLLKAEGVVRLTNDSRKQPVVLCRGEVSKFCRDNGLSRGGVLRVIRKQQSHYKGWRLE